MTCLKSEQHLIYLKKPSGVKPLLLHPRRYDDDDDTGVLNLGYTPGYSLCLYILNQFKRCQSKNIYLNATGSGVIPPLATILNKPQSNCLKIDLFYLILLGVFSKEYNKID